MKWKVMQQPWHYRGGTWQTQKISFSNAGHEEATHIFNGSWWSTTVPHRYSLRSPQ